MANEPQGSKHQVGGGKESMNYECNQAKAAYRQLEGEYHAGITNSLIAWEDFLENRGLSASTCPR